MRFVLLVRPWPFHPCVVGGGGLGPLDTLLVFACACGRTTCPFLALGLVACVFGGGGVCSPVACGSLLPVSYHHFFPLGLPIRYSLIPLMFRSAVLCWRPYALCVFFGGVHIFLGAGSLLSEIGEEGVGSCGGCLVGGRVGDVGWGWGNGTLCPVRYRGRPPVPSSGSDGAPVSGVCVGGVCAFGPERAPGGSARA